ncbi:zonular occludens toxin domain-containing protein [Acinetobacter towneri]|uniref:zonular occludens toxin domain-containing protein n=1 Tax=Acinetobacter towneri TaxID=202956 RepID=UPI002097A06E|nr:zonular occludens toxin domain-containing protein [Acinetobacter towneri]MCO8058164.1 zonular occludens toxin domain-containing protein [Acinetobacter towneri]MCO8063811.1 zonular occludens toxin domain-containing protein [Acinetobacter towneri]
MINLVTGTLGSGKTLFVVNELRKIHLANQQNIKILNKKCADIYNSLKDNPDDHIFNFTRDEMIELLGEKEVLSKIRPIYSNIDGLLIPHKPTPDDWRECPKGSVIVYDECHKFELFSRTREQVSRNPIMIEMNESRHLGIDFYFITQSPKYISHHLSGIVGSHYHLHRPMNAKAASVFLWRYTCTSPNSRSSKSLTESDSIFNYPKTLFNYYKSSDSHTHKFKLPKKFIYLLLALLSMISFIVYLGTRDSTIGNLTGHSFTGGVQSKTVVEQDKSVSDSDPLTSSASDPVYSASAASESVASNQIVYDPSDPFTTEDFSQYQNRTYQTAPVLAGCIKTHNSCDCYTQQATKIKNMKRSDCLRIIDEGLPFNPFKTQTQNNYSASAQSNDHNDFGKDATFKDAVEPNPLNYVRN